MMMCVLLAGCQGTGGGKVRTVDLPPPPSCMAPVAVPEIRVGDDARAALARQRAALATANGHLDCSKDWYEAVRLGYGER